MAAGGNSGGPCFLKSEPILLPNSIAIPKERFIGIISKSFEREISEGYSHTRYVGGLSLVTPSDKILGLLRSDDMNNYLERIKEKLQKLLFRVIEKE